MAPRSVREIFRELIIVSIVLAIALKAVEGGRTLLENAYGHISSPGFPNSYPSNQNHIWEIRAPQDYRIKLVFHTLDLEKCTDCNCDYVAISYGGGRRRSNLGKFCNQTITPFISRTRVMVVEFKTNRYYSGKGFNATYTTEFDFESIVPYETQRNLYRYFLNSRQQNHSVNKWGMDITRTAVALYLHDPQFFAAGRETGEEITKELILQLMSKLVMNKMDYDITPIPLKIKIISKSGLQKPQRHLCKKKRISTKDLALFMNAMTVSCIDPKKFFGLNVVSELRRRIDNSNHTNPFFILALCNAGENMTMEDVLKLQQLFDSHLRLSWTGTQAMVVMALECIARQSQINLDATLDMMILKIKEKQQNSGRIQNNFKTTALVIQALKATDRYRTNFNLSMAIKSVLQDMKNTQLSTEEMYHILPIFKGKSLLDISSIHCGNFTKTDFDEVKTVIQKQPDERVQVQISVIIGDDMDFTRTSRIKFPSYYSIYQALENISSSDSHFKIQYTISEGKRYISGLATFKDSIEDGMFWFIYTKPLSSNGDPVLFEKSLFDIRVSVTDELILWYRSGP